MAITHPVLAADVLARALGLDPSQKPYISDITLKIEPTSFPTVVVTYVLTEEEQVGLIANALAEYELRRKDA